MAFTLGQPIMTFFNVPDKFPFIDVEVKRFIRNTLQLGFSRLAPKTARGIPYAEVGLSRLSPR